MRNAECGIGAHASCVSCAASCRAMSGFGETKSTERQAETVAAVRRTTATVAMKRTARRPFPFPANRQKNDRAPAANLHPTAREAKGARKTSAGKTAGKINVRVGFISRTHRTFLPRWEGAAGQPRLSFTLLTKNQKPIKRARHTPGRATAHGKASSGKMAVTRNVTGGRSISPHAIRSAGFRQLNSARACPHLPRGSPWL